MNFKKIVPQTLGGDVENIWNLIFGGQSLLEGMIMNRKPLWKFVSDEKLERVMEIGFGVGLNSIVMKGLTNAELYIFDLMEPPKDGWVGNEKTQRRTYDIFKDVKKVKFFLGDTRKTLPQYVDELPEMDLIFIDGGHSYEVCKNDWKHSKELMHEETTVWFHDYDMEGVKKVVDEIKNYKVEIIEPEFGPVFAKVEAK